jgi:hypothetical protein
MYRLRNWLGYMEGKGVTRKVVIETSEETERGQSEK